MINVQWEDEVLKENEYQEEDLMAETSSEAKRSHDLKSDILCKFAGEIHEDGKILDIVIEKKKRDRI